MKKIPTIFERDWEGDRSRVLDKANPAADWVFSGEGVATRKYDGTAAAIIGGKLYKRLEMSEEQMFSKGTPPGAIECDSDAQTAKRTFWVPVTDGPEDRWFREAFKYLVEPADGTYELLGPKIQGNPEALASHTLLKHSDAQTYESVPRTWAGIRDWMENQDIEGLVFHHPDGRMAKIKKRDFGLKRKPVVIV